MNEEYIERTDAIARIQKVASMIGFENPAVAIDSCIAILKRMPVSNAVKVVKCGQCKHRGKLYRAHLCDHPNALLGRVTDDTFCSYGEQEVESNETSTMVD